MTQLAQRIVQKIGENADKLNSLPPEHQVALKARIAWLARAGGHQIEPKEIGRAHV